MSRTALRRAVLVAVASLLPVATVVAAAPAHANAPLRDTSTAADQHGSKGERGSDHYERVGYFIQWGIYDRNFFVRDVDANGTAARLTTINYAFGNVSREGRCFETSQPGEGDPWADYQRPFAASESVDGVADAPGQALNGNFNQLRKLRAQHPNLRVQMSLGGFTWSRFFSNAALTPQSRRDFVASCIDLFLKGNLPQLDGAVQGGAGSGAGVFDGFDIDWEWPTSPLVADGVGRPEDRQNATLLLAEFRRQLDDLGRRNHRHYTLSAFLPADPARVAANFEVPQIFRYLDFATVQGYDLHGTWENTTNHQSAIVPPAADPSPEHFSVDLAIQAYLSRHVPSRKLVLGVPFYGRGWTGVPDVNHGLFQPSGGPAPARFEAGVEDYKTLVSKPGFTVFRDRRAGFAWLFDGTTFWTFDDPQVMAQKAAYVRSHHLGGVMAWSLDSDDSTGSLMHAVDQGLRH